MTQSVVRVAPRLLFPALGSGRVWLLAALLVLMVATAGRAQALQGFGTETAGGAGQPVYHVTTLDDSGTGSLRDAVSAGNRMVVFDVGGTIELTSPIFVRGANITIDGFTAPLPGITLHGDGLIIRGNVGVSNSTPASHVIVRGLRIRHVPIDGVQIAYGAHHIVLSNLSVFDSGDGLIDITEHSHDVTVAWSILAGAIKAMLVKYNPSRVTLHHNMWAGWLDPTTPMNRNPQVAVDDHGTWATEITVDMRNNLVYNWQGGAGTTVHHGAWANVVANFYSSPPSLLLDQEQALLVCRGTGCFDGDLTNTSRAYTQGNVSGDFLSIDINAAGTESTPFAVEPATAVVTTDDACTAARSVLASAGARPLDATDVGFLAPIAFPICRLTTTALKSTASPAVFGAPVTFTATVQPKPPASGMPGGSITFYKGSTVLETRPLVGGTATLDSPVLTVGATTIKAVYSGDPDFDASPAASFQQKISAAATSTAFVVGRNPTPLGDPVTLTATVTALLPSTAIPAGTIKFYDGSKVLFTQRLVDGVALVTTWKPPAGVRLVKAQFSGDSGFADSSTTLKLTVDGGTTTSLTRSTTKPRAGEAVTFTATVSPVTGGGTPTGTVKFSDGTKVLAAQQPLANGTAILTTSTLSVGGHTVVASYNGSSSFMSSDSPPVSVSVVQGDTKTALSATPLALHPGQSVTFTAVVTPSAPAAGIPGGSVTFKDGGKVLAAPVPLVGGTARFSTTALAVGARSITASYGGDASFKSSNSPKLTVTVGP